MSVVLCGVFVENVCVECMFVIVHDMEEELRGILGELEQSCPRTAQLTDCNFPGSALGNRL